MENNKCECNQKELCIKMRNTALRKCVCILKEKISQKYVFDVSITFQSIINLLQTYNCKACKKMIKRVKWVRKTILKFSCDADAKEIIKILITELETFSEIA